MQRTVRQDGLLVYDVPSKSESGTYHHVLIETHTGEVSCDCTGYVANLHRRAVLAGETVDASTVKWHCRHLKAALADCLARGDFFMNVPHPVVQKGECMPEDVEALVSSTQVLDQLRQPIDPARVKRNKHVEGAYLTSYDVINQMNTIFGYDGWSDKIVSVDPTDGNNICWKAVVEVAAKIGSKAITHSDVGFCIAAVAHNSTDNLPSPKAIETAYKGAASDAFKRACRKFGAQFGNDLYDKDSEFHTAAFAASQGVESGQARGNYNLSNNGSARPSQAPAAASSNGASNGAGPAFEKKPCPKCGGEMWDNRQQKASGKMNSNRPDFACKDRDNCNGVIWPPRTHERPAMGPPRPQPSPATVAAQNDAMGEANPSPNCPEHVWLAVRGCAPVVFGENWMLELEAEVAEIHQSNLRDLNNAGWTTIWRDLMERSMEAQEQERQGVS